MHILVVEDEPKVAAFIQKGLQAEQYGVAVVSDGESALQSARTVFYDLIILDLLLPKVDGLTVLKQLRSQGVTTPVLVLTARGSVEDRVQGLGEGADDYLVKPFAFEELLARIRVLLRRTPGMVRELRVADLELDPLRRRVTRGGRLIELTPREFAVLEYLMRNSGQPVTRAMLVEQVWEKGFDGLSNVVDVYVNYLRTKIDRDADVKLIRTVRGVGYMLLDPSAALGAGPNAKS